MIKYKEGRQKKRKTEGWPKRENEINNVCVGVGMGVGVWLWAWVCVCVGVRERERERES